MIGKDFYLFMKYKLFAFFEIIIFWVYFVFVTLGILLSENIIIFKLK